MTTLRISTAFALLFLIPAPMAEATSGCCSWHGGVDSCGSSGYYMCNDGTRSPTCTCGGSSYTPSSAIQYNSPESDVQYFKQLNSPSNTTASCRSRFGEGSITGMTQCECVGGYDWNTDRTACVKQVINNYLKDAPESSSERLKVRVKAIKTDISTTIGSSSSLSAMSKARIEIIKQCRISKAGACLCISGHKPKVIGGKQVCAK